MKKRRSIFWICLGMIGLGAAQEKEASGIRQDGYRWEEPQATWEMTCEIFSLPLQDAAELRRKQPDSEAIYEELVQRVGKSAAVPEEFVVMKTLVAGSSASVSAEEFIFPTEYDPPDLPSLIGDQVPDDAPQGIRSPAHPTSFDTRNLGLTMKVEVTGLDSPEVISLKFSAARVVLAGIDTWGRKLAEARIPRFQVQELKEEITFRNGQRILVGSMSPPWTGGEGERRVWLAFVKARVVFEEQRPEEGESERDVERGVTYPLNASCEVFALGLSEAAKLKREGMPDAEVYAYLAKSKSASLREFVTLQALDGRVIVSKSVREMSYGTSYDPAEVPNAVSDLSASPEVMKTLVTPANPTAFETKEVGSRIELGLIPQVGEKVRLAGEFELSDFLGRDSWGKGKAEVEMPRFASQRLIFQTSVRPDRPLLLGSLSPPAALQPRDGERQVWLAFVTVSEDGE